MLISVAMATRFGETLHRSPSKCRKRLIIWKWCEIRQTFVLNINSKPWVGFENPLLFWSPCQSGRTKRFTAETASSIKQQKLVLETLQFFNYCRSRVNRIKQQKLALPISCTLDSFNGRQLMLQAKQITHSLLYLF